MRGPVAPKDPVKKRPCLYVVLDQIIAGRKEDGKYQDHIYLEGRLEDQVRFTSGEIDDSIIALLGNVADIRKLVHSIGITIKGDEEDHEKEAKFICQCYGKTQKYMTGTQMEAIVPCSGEEVIMEFASYPINEEDTVLGQFNIELPSEHKNAVLTVKLYLNDGYEVPEIEVDPPIQYDTPEYKEMIGNSLVSTGNNFRLKRVIERTKAGDEVTIAYIGGSITQGAGAKPINTECYAYQSYKAFCDLFSPCDGENVHYVKAGIGGTSSELGIVRYDRDVCEDGKIKPDLVIVEYAVNDEGDETGGVCYESLVKKILAADNEPAVLLLFSVFMNDFNLQDRLQPIGERYDLPMVSVKDALVPQFKESKILTKRQYFYDIFHPTNDGHRIMADCIRNLYE
ncbi:MAG: SGNH/GDSL hydrolase family protein, partial [Clostridiales bacterium]|nr:SGNH/GDSL hydrolase family protein [Clostridiales bacterium]